MYATITLILDLELILVQYAITVCMHMLHGNWLWSFDMKFGIELLY